MAERPRVTICLRRTMCYEGQDNMGGALAAVLVTLLLLAATAATIELAEIKPVAPSSGAPAWGAASSRAPASTK